MIDKLIFNRLARREGVNLPGVGSLGVTFSPAIRNGQSIEPPANQIVFSRRKNSIWPALPALIEQEAVVDPETAQQYYERWLSQARRDDGTVVIGGTGEIRKGIFTSSPELKSVVERGFTYPSIRLRKRGNLLKISSLFLLVAVVAFLAIFAHLRPYTVSRVIDPLSRTAHRPAVNPVAADSAAIAVINGDTTQSGSQQPEPPEIAPVSETATQSADNQNVISGSPIYHLVAGVFSTEGNADRFIAESKRKGATFSYRKVTMNNGRILVSIFASGDKSEADRRRVEMRSTSPDLWIYTEQ